MGESVKRILVGLLGFTIIGAIAGLFMGFVWLTEQIDWLGPVTVIGVLVLIFAWMLGDVILDGI